MTINLHIPARWQEMNTDQLRAVVESATLGLCREDCLLLLFLQFTGIKMVAGTAYEDERKVVHTRFKDADGRLFDLEDWQVSDFCGKLSFVFEDMPMDVAWPFKWDRYLMGTSFGDWFHADAQMLGYVMDGNLDRLKRAMKDLGDPHDTLQPNDPDIILFQKWYECFKEWLQARYPLLFKKVKSGTTAPTSPIETRQNIMLMLNEGRPQDNNAVEKSNVHDVLAALQYKIEYNEQTKKRMNNILH